MEELFSVDDVMEMRALNVASLPDRCDILQESIVVEEGGKETVTWPAIATAVPCRLSAASGSESEFVQADELQTANRWILVLDVNAPIREKHHVRVTVTPKTGLTPTTQELNVVAVLGPKTYEVERKVMCSDLLGSGR